jgi:aminopeptidase
MAGLDPAKISRWRKTTEELLNERLEKKWVATRFPTSGMAQNARMSTHEFEDMVFNSVINVDYASLEKKNSKVKEVFDAGEEIRIVGRNTDMSFSLEKREGVMSSGNSNIPDGEVFYAPIKESVEGSIEFTYPSFTAGNRVSGVKLEFENGRIVGFSADENQEFLKSMIETDEGSRYIGEFGIGTNEMITEFVGDTLFDEKMAGTIHLALGRAYERCVPDGEERNQSGIHWDLVKDLRPDHGGGKIMVDDKTVQEDGEWKID